MLKNEQETSLFYLTNIYIIDILIVLLKLKIEYLSRKKDLEAIWYTEQFKFRN
jgi:hypothetical protein